MYAHVSREEWLFRGLAIATILALVGMAVLPAVNMVDLAAYYIYTHDGLRAYGCTMGAAGLMWLVMKIGGELAAEELIALSAGVAIGTAVGMGILLA